MTDDVNAQLKRAADWHERQGRRPIHGGFQGEARHMRELDRKKHLAFAALLARGVDPKRPRRFRGRITVTAQCKPEGHELGHVYPTDHGPVWVPTVNAPAGPRGQPSSVEQRRVAEQLAPLGLPPRRFIARDPWFELRDPVDWLEDDTPPRAQDAEVSFDGMTYLGGDRSVAEDYLQLAYVLMCRCGQRVLYVSRLDEALRNAERRVFV